MSAVHIEQPSLEDRIRDQLAWHYNGSRFSELRIRNGVSASELHKTLYRMWCRDVIRRTPGTKGKCRYVLARLRPDVPGKSQYVPATRRSAHARVGNGTLQPLGAPSGYDAPAPQTIKLEVGVVCLGLADALLGEADRLMADAQRHVKLAAALTQWANNA